MTTPHWLEITEYISLATATLGTIAATATQQIIYAALPLSISVGLNIANRQRLYELNQKQIEIAMLLASEAIAKFQQRITELESLTQNSYSKITQLEDTLSQLPILRQNNSVIQPLQALAETFLPPPVLIENTYNWQSVKTITVNSTEITAVGISPDQEIIATNGLDYSIKIWDINTGSAKLTLKGNCDRIIAITLSSDGKTLASTSADKTIKLWDIYTQRETTEYWATLPSNLKRESPKILATSQTIQGHLYYFLTIAFSPDNMTIASGSTDCTIKLWDVKTLQQKRILTGHRDKIQAIAFSPNGESIASGSWDSTIKIWDISPNPDKDTITLNGHQGVIHTLAFHPDGKLLLSGSADKTIKVWDINTGTEICRKIGHQDEVRCVAFSPDGKMIASGSCDRTIKLWHLHGDLICTLSEHSAPIKSISFTSDGQLLISISLDKTIKIWQYSEGLGARG
ncbi:MAG TPA: hypothetical protein DEA78_21600 [Cyanobacteria bacterium UBA11159]|nr:hypothetical protein [Cyanobacteria bacterium UBA11366]HBK64644.1 hypothetical protein [Cyanobacteria bacterium UBA11166]HBR76208.1 hypothetical protein [Cyanobacteria bacterium UBA11159]HBS68130.1 hypothetical protein [Cyanobacteria bacterium UBA11153]